MIAKNKPLYRIKFEDIDFYTDRVYYRLQVKVKFGMFSFWRTIGSSMSKYIAEKTIKELKSL